MHICILQTDSVREEFVAQHGDYPAMFERLLREASGGEPLTFSCVDARVGLPPAPTADAYLITGSRHSVYEPLPWIADLAEFVRLVLSQNKKIIGVCFGHQLMAHFFGGMVAKADVGWGVGVHQAQVQPRAWMADEKLPEMGLLCSHQDQVLQAPPEADVYLRSEFCPISGFTMGDQVITVQGHPEFLPAYASDLMDYRRDQLGHAVHAQGQASLRTPTQELSMARWMLNFCRAPNE